MVVDDTPTNLRILVALLAKHGYAVQALTDGPAALAAIEADPPDILLLDIDMPEMDGFEVCHRLKADPLLAEIPVLFISALDHVDDKVRGFEAGGADYITKPFQFEEILARMNAHLELRRYREQAVEEAQLATIHALVALAESRDDATGKHIQRVQLFCRLLAEQIRAERHAAEPISDNWLDTLTHASPLHDIGKVGIPDRVLLKPARLDPVEFSVMQTHAALGAATLETVRRRYPRSDFINLGVEIAGYHHEKWDGTGYPARLAGGAIPLSARIVALADVYDALRSERCYKPAFPHDKANGIILAEDGNHFDPTVVRAYRKLSGRLARVYDEMSV
ncbi:MAG: response regulator [Armatimonadetes bacterium]|nr:response regulator [Armatimonadota bacterium]